MLILFVPQVIYEMFITITLIILGFMWSYCHLLAEEIISYLCPCFPTFETVQNGVKLWKI